jgi:CRISPR-associated endonuclease/helicase Cas3
MRPQALPTLFEELTGSPPFPWQEALLARFINSEIPDSANLPTGLGKTSIVAIWLCALALAPGKTPRRLVYVVNRRTVVDQTTAEAERLRNALNKPALAELRDALASLCALPLATPHASPLAISTLRGQFADNGEWCADPTRPAVIVGTVDMIGSGLLFSRYTRGFKTRPLHAGFLGQDALLVHDEAHLEPAFQKLLESIVAAQNASNDPRKLRVIELTATSRAVNSNADVKPFGLDENPNDKDTDNETVQKRFNATKQLSLVPVTKTENGEDKANDGTVRDKKHSGRAVLIFVRSVEAATRIKDELAKQKCRVATLTGTMRGKERDELVTVDPVFQRFVSENDRAAGVEATPGTVFLVATSAGEVGVNISSDDLVCDVSTYESMAQRFGRVNRFGERKGNDASEITVVYRTNLQANYDEGLSKANSAKKDPEKKVAAYEKKHQSVLRLIKTLALLEKLNGNASPAALEGLPATERIAAFSPPPELRVATEIQFDAWALTSIREPIAARPPVAPYLHGEAEWQPPETHVAWREELDVLDTAELRAAYPPADLLEDFPLKPHELLRDTSERILHQVAALLRERQEKGAPLPDAWLVGEGGNVTVFPLARLVSNDGAAAEEAEHDGEEDGNDGADKKAEKAREDRAIAALANATLILPASLGGIDKNGLLTPNATRGAEGKADVADIVAKDADDKIHAQRCRVWNNTPDVPAALANAGFHLVRTIDKCLDKENAEDSEDASPRYWLWLEAKASEIAGARIGHSAETLATHTSAVAANAAAIAAKCLPDKSALAAGEPDLRRCIVVAARLHDLGKNRAEWQRNLGNLAYDSAKPETILAKSTPGMRVRNVAERYRHEFGSLHDSVGEADFAALADAERDVVLHIIAAHHGRARPHFPADEVFDYASDSLEELASLATDIPRRFARLQQRHGRWGLAWLESVLRAADYAASGGIVAPDDTATRATDQRVQDAGFRTRVESVGESTVPTATLAVHPANPGHYFACCGLFELAARLSPTALAWFAQDTDTGEWRFHLADTPPLAGLLGKITAAEISALDPHDGTASPLQIGIPFNVRLDWWKTSARDTAALKVWAGTMECPRIARAMQDSVKTAAGAADFISERLLFDTRIAYDTEAPAKKVEPFYFDANRGPNAHSRDVGFAPNDLKLETLAAPAVELLALVGLQRAIPAPDPRTPRNFDYRLWARPLPVSLLPTAVNGLLPDNSRSTHRFESWFRTGQRKHKAFLTARLISSR